MLFLQGTRDALADIALMQSVTGRLAPLATLKRFDDADHSFHVPARSARNDDAILAELLDTVRDWSARIAIG